MYSFTQALLTVYYYAVSSGYDHEQNLVPALMNSEFTVKINVDQIKHRYKITASHVHNAM